MAGPEWLGGVSRVAANDGGRLVGGPPRWVWHTYEADPARLSAVVGARALRAAGNSVHFVFNPLSGDIVQLLPASRSRRSLVNSAGGVETNRMGSVCLQVEVIAFASNPFTGYLTPAGRAGLAKLVGFARAHGIPDVWPAGPPPRYPPGDGNRSTSIWTTRGGHYGHSQVPENDHGDPGAIDPRVLFAGNLTATRRGNGMDLYRDSKGRVWDVGPLGRRYIVHPDVVSAYQGNGGRVSTLSDAALATLPRLPDGGLPTWVLAQAAPPAPPATVDVEALAAALIPHLPVGIDPRSVATAVAADLAARLAA